MRKFIKIIITVLVTTPLVYIATFSIASPSLAPTKEIKILGASSEEENQLKGFANFELSDEIDTNDITATSYYVENLNTNSVITKKYSKNPLPIASLTKLMTAWVTHRYGSFNDEYTITSSDTESISPTLGLVVGDKVKVNDLINSLLIGSANDAAVALGGYLESKENKPIEDLMNEEIINLGLSNSRFQNPIGLDSISNYASAEDIAILVKKLQPTGIFENTSKAEQYNFKSIQNNSYSVPATNKLINKYPNLYAIKTGFTNTALGSMVNILRNDDQQYLIIVIGSPDREGDTVKLMNKVLQLNQ